MEIQFEEIFNKRMVSLKQRFKKNFMNN